MKTVLEDIRSLSVAVTPEAVPDTDAQRVGGQLPASICQKFG